MDSRQRTTLRLPWWHGWLPLLVLPWTALLLPADSPKWLVMWALAGSIYAGCKWLTWRRNPTQGVPRFLHVGYLLAWPGMDSAAFLHPTLRPSDRPRPSEWPLACGKLALGVGLLALVVPRIPRIYPQLTGWMGMIGIVLVLHFGTFHVLSCFWRSLGVAAKPLMNWPVAAVSVGEFWSRRWNLAFRDLTHRFLFRPISQRLGPRSALWIGFAFSGLVHDLVISLPAGGGYGGPSLYFVVQAAAILIERSPLGRRIGLASGWRGWMFASLVLLAPAGALFHPPFVRRVVLPFLDSLEVLG